MEDIKKDLKEVILKLFDITIEPNLNRPDYDFGDYSTNVAFELVKSLKKNPTQVAQEIRDELSKNSDYSKVEVVNPGFLNIKLKDSNILKLLDLNFKTSFDNKVIVSEYSDPNPFKQLHVGHLFTSIVGDALSNLIGEVASKVVRVNFGGDIGLHVAKNIYAIQGEIEGDLSKLSIIDSKDRSSWLSKCYLKGNEAFDSDEKAKANIIGLNKEIYNIAVNNLKDSDLAQIYWTTREWSYDYFKEFYNELNISFDKYYPESSVSELGLKIVKDNLGKVFSKSDQAIIFDGSNEGVNTYVYVNSKGLPTYSAKDVGLIFQKWQDFKFDYSIVISGNEQADYMKTVLRSVSKIDSNLSDRSIHLTHGIVKGASGAKFSSRLGNAPLAEDLITETFEAFKKISKEEINIELVRAAIKYSFLKQRYSGDIIFDPNEAVALEGKSGPYLLYAYVRALKIVTKSQFDKTLIELDPKSINFNQNERRFLFKITEFKEILREAIVELKPHLLAIYLYELAQIFNVFYENDRVLNDPKEELRVALIRQYLLVLKKGLNILGIDTIDKM